MNPLEGNDPGLAALANRNPEANVYLCFWMAAAMRISLHKESANIPGSWFQIWIIFSEMMIPNDEL